MKITANQITALRIVLLPLPLFLIYGGPFSRLMAILILAVLGLTDYLDGVLARKYGVTSLGRLLDPIADKIFIAVTLVPLADLHILPMWIVWPIFFREFLVTEMRRFMTPGQKGLRVTELAKIKTTLQMTGVGLILLTNTFSDRLPTIFFLAGLFLATLFLAVAISSKSGELTGRLKSALLLEGMGLAIAVALPARQVELAYGVVLLVVTLVSGAQYFLASSSGLLKRGIWPVLDLFLSLVNPLFALLLLPFTPGSSHLLVVLILAMEFAVQGIDMWAVQEGRADLSLYKKRFFSPFLVLVFVAMLASGAGLGAASATFLVLCSFGSVLYLLVDVWFHRSLFKKGEFFS